MGVQGIRRVNAHTNDYQYRCQVCRARKTKCDNAKPSCSYCLSVGATCIQSPFDLSSFDPASLRILERLDELEHLLRERPGAPEQPDASERNKAPSNSRMLDDYRDGHLHLKYAMQSPETAASASAICVPPLRSVLPESLEHILGWTSTSEFSGLGSSIGSLVGLAELETHGINELLDRFFMHVHCKNPILDETETRRLVRVAFMEGLDWSPASCLAMLVCALGSISTPSGPSHDVAPHTKAYRDAETFFYAAQKRMGPLILQPSIIGTQCLFLSGVYLMCVFRLTHAWRYFSNALAACQNFPFLTKSPSSQVVAAASPGSDISADDVLEQAVYWSAWKSEREVRQELALTDFPTDSGTHYPTFFPTPPPPSVGTPDGFTDPVDLRARGSWLFYLAEISLRRLNSRLCSEIRTLHERCTTNTASASSDTYHFLQALASMIPEYENQARQWADSLPTELTITQDATQMERQDEHICRAVLRGHLYDLWELIYWPFVMATIELLAAGRPLHEHPPFIRDICHRGLKAHVRRLHINRPVFLHRHHGTWFMMRCCARSSLVLAIAASRGAHMPSGWREAVHMVLGMLGYWAAEVRGADGWKEAIEMQLSKAALRP
ncbi:hypothetical protein PG985_007649 [Apiospora marii]|uniref:uncharacterized protein n=1 Tax=Apiospora marii TaxID=335849 RepID=UPI00312F5EAF